MTHHFLIEATTFTVHAFVVAFIAAAILTPPDPISQLGLAIPIILLYEISILCAKVVEKRREEADQETEAAEV